MFLVRLDSRLTIIVARVLAHAFPISSSSLRHDSGQLTVPSTSSLLQNNEVSTNPFRFSPASFLWPWGVQTHLHRPPIDLKMDGFRIDVLTATASDLQEYLRNGEITSVKLVYLYLEQIEKHNHQGLHLNGVIETAPRNLLIQEAQKLDDERASGNTRGRLHGIPIIVKV